jgi:hypothetical protein
LNVIIPPLVCIMLELFGRLVADLEEECPVCPTFEGPAAGGMEIVTEPELCAAVVTGTKLGGPDNRS